MTWPKSKSSTIRINDSALPCKKSNVPTDCFKLSLFDVSRFTILVSAGWWACNVQPAPTNTMASAGSISDDCLALLVRCTMHSWVGRFPCARSDFVTRFLLATKYECKTYCIFGSFPNFANFTQTLCKFSHYGGLI